MKDDVLMPRSDGLQLRPTCHVTPWSEPWRRAAVHVHRTTIAEHNHVAALNVIRGAGDVNITHRYALLNNQLFVYIY